eukprot:m.71095 g.71095  ORF g.71095 m.71095 type:complete len:1393 (+) comp12208_c0_seq1:11-4189(+)
MAASGAGAVVQTPRKERKTGRAAYATPGEKVFIPDKEECFKLCVVKTNNGKEVVSFDEDYKSYTTPIEDVFPANPDSMHNVDDNTELMYLHDPSLLNNIEQRYKTNQIYTFTAFILIAVNPYQKLPLYGDDEIKKYAKSSIGRLPPHVYALANRAFTSMRTSGQNQSMVVSGESGAGKTETCKHIMRFMAAVGGKGEIGSIDQLEQKVLDANPLLEAFGNAKTVRNNNSSRFGKFTQLHFERNAADMVASLSGASIETYLLEKSRVLSHQNSERSFHIFYQLLAANPKLGKPMDQYGFLSKGNCTTIEGVDDVEEFATVKKAMDSIGVTSQEQSDLWDVLIGLLELGNVSFEDQGEDKAADPAQLTKEGKAAVVAAGSALKMDADTLETRMLTREMKAGGDEAITIQLSNMEAGHARDSLCKYIYGQIFTWLVDKINKAVPGTNADSFIGILDISGFEIFEHNTFEQFCINFANEKIQQFFNSQILRQEQEIYELEGLRYRKVEFDDNQSLISLIDAKRTGIFALLDEACLMPRGNDKSFSIKLHTTHSAHNALMKPKYTKGNKKRLKDDEAFVIGHFAGAVTYETTGFLDKNNDTIHDGLLSVLSESKSKFMKDLCPKEEDEISFGPHGGRFKSVSARFTKQLASLMTTLNKTVSNFIRCIKPNQLQKPAILDRNSVMTQLRYSGMCAALLLMQAGFPTRISFKELHERYASRMPAMLQKLKPVTFCEALLVALDLDGGKDFQMGLTKVFFRSGKLAFMDELTTAAPENVEAIVKKVKVWLARKRFFAAGHAVRALVRTMKLVEGYRAFLRFRKAANIMTRIVRGINPVLVRVRKKLYSEEVMRKRREEEEERKRKEDEERKRKEEEELARQKAEEERIRKEEEERQQAIERERKRQEEERRNFEARIAELTELCATQASKIETSESQLKESKKMLETEREAKTTLEQKVITCEDQIKADDQKMTALNQRMEEEKVSMQEKLEELGNAYKGDQATQVARLQKMEEEKSALEGKLRDSTESNRALQAELDSLKARHQELKDNSTTKQNELQKSCDEIETTLNETKSSLEGKVAKLEEELALVSSALQTTKDDLAKRTEEKSKLTNLLETFTAVGENLKAKLKESETTGEALAELLRKERHGREDDNHANKQLIEEIQAKAINDLEVKDAVITSLKSDKATLEADLKKEVQHASITIAEYIEAQGELQDKVKTLSNELREEKNTNSSLTAKLAEVEENVNVLQKEKANLIDVAIKCQESQLKLRSIYGKFKKEAELLSLVYDDISYENLMRSAIKVGMLSKQAGSNVKKWDARQIIVLDKFCVFYETRKAKTPKGIIRMDHSRAEGVDLSGIGKQFGIRVTDMTTTKEYFFCAQSDPEREEWIDALERAEAAL